MTTQMATQMIDLSDGYCFEGADWTETIEDMVGYYAYSQGRIVEIKRILSEGLDDDTTEVILEDGYDFNGAYPSDVSDAMLEYVELEQERLDEIEAYYYTVANYDGLTDSAIETLVLLDQGELSGSDIAELLGESEVNAYQNDEIGTTDLVDMFVENNS